MPAVSERVHATTTVAEVLFDDVPEAVPQLPEQDRASDHFREGHTDTTLLIPAGFRPASGALYAEMMCARKKGPDPCLAAGGSGPRT